VLLSSFQPRTSLTLVFFCFFLCFFPLEKTSSQYGEGWSSSDQVARNGQGQPQLVRRTRGTARTGTKREKDDDEKKK
jgi:hypothetical protein